MKLRLAEGASLAEATVVRSIVVVWGTAALVFFCLGLGPILLQSAFVPPWWNLPAAVAIFAVPPLLALATPVLALRVIRGTLAVYAVLYLVVVASFPLVMDAGPLPLESPPWPLGVTGLGTVAVALVWRPVFVWTYLGIHAFAMAGVRAIASGGVDASVPLQDGIFVISFTAIFTTLALMSLRNARVVDAVTKQTQDVAARTVATIARTREQGRLDALVHDEVMSAFLYASRDSPGLAAAVQRQAGRALEQLQRVARGEPIGGSTQPAELVDRMRAITFELSGSAFSVVNDSRTASVPSEVASALVEAAAEALRNCVNHAAHGSRPLTVEVTLALEPEAVIVTVDDDGVGFTPAAVDPRRLGISVSITGRLALLAGGSATVTSRPGHGTRVRLEWRDQ